MTNYILNRNHEPIPTDDFEVFGAWFENGANRVVKQENVGPYFVSTVFLGNDHNFHLSGPPVLFETMVFDNESREESAEDFNYQRRCCTWKEAEAMHAEAVKEVRRHIGLNS